MLKKRINMKALWKKTSTKNFQIYRMAKSLMKTKTIFYGRKDQDGNRIREEEMTKEEIWATKTTKLLVWATREEMMDITNHLVWATREDMMDTTKIKPLVWATREEMMDTNIPKNNMKEEIMVHLSIMEVDRKTINIKDNTKTEDTENDSLDDMSDISDGDIPEVDEVPDEKKEDTNQSTELELEESAMVVDEDIEDRQQNPVDIIPEDMEEISDEEADWSDDGDCFFLDPDSYRVDFGSDWVEPIAIFKPDEHALTELKYYCNNTANIDNEEESKNNSDKLVDKLNQMPLGSEWVEALETIDVSSLDSTIGLASILKRGLSLSEALKQPVHTFKLRHLKSSLKLVNHLFDSNLSWELDDLLEIVNILMKILSDPASIAALIKRLGKAVLMPTQQGFPSAPGTSACSQVQASLRVGDGAWRRRTRCPGISTPVIGPVLAQWAVTQDPSFSSMSARKRL